MKLGFVIIMAGFENVVDRQPRYAEIRDMALCVENAGLDSIWLYDHLLYRFPGQSTVGIWECWSVLSALAEATSRVEIGTLVTCNSFRNPAILAKMAVTVDEISAGRLTLGIGAGWNKPEYDAFGIPFDYRYDRFEESLQIIRPLLKEGRVDFEGKYYRALDCEITPRGPRKEGPPLMIGTLRGPRMIRMAAQYGDIWNSAYYDEPTSYVEPLAMLRAACEDVSRDPETLEVTATIALAYPDLGSPPTHTPTYFTGSANPDKLAEAFLEYETLGVSHLMVECTPYGEAGLERVVASMDAYRKATSEEGG
jgi:alkanesulfonate monooxygenase SsuD/methylene tetrahydromethanopterin reductase-like flavin-dependent oxidoreductase (luciferase family)